MCPMATIPRSLTIPSSSTGKNNGRTQEAQPFLIYSDYYSFPLLSLIIPHILSLFLLFHTIPLYYLLLPIIYYLPYVRGWSVGGRWLRKVT